jgi:transposase
MPWRQLKAQSGASSKSTHGLTEEQKQIRQLQKELKEALLERDILKKAVGIFSKGDGRTAGRKSSGL